MIFKNEGEQWIQRMTTEAPEAEQVDVHGPFDYRSELTIEDRSMMQRELEKRIDKVLPVDYLHLASAMKYLNLPIPPQSELTQIKIARHAENALNHWNPQRGFSFTEPTDTETLRTALFDVTKFKLEGDLRGWMVSRIAETRDEDKRPVVPSFEEVAAVRLLIPEMDCAETLTKMREHLVQTISQLTSREGQTNKSAWQLVLKNLALLRIAGGTEMDWQHAITWKTMRQYFLPKTGRPPNIANFAMNAFYARVLMAEKVSVDKDGLHIQDPIRKFVADDTPPPLRKHI